MRLRQWIALAVRESRGSAGRLVFFAACLSVGVAAVVAVAGLSQALDSGIQARARELLAADLAVYSRRPIPDDVVAAVDASPGRDAPVSSSCRASCRCPQPTTSPAAPGPSLLCELKAVGPGYPFYGEVVTEPGRPLAELLGADRVLVGPELLDPAGRWRSVTACASARRLFTIGGTVTAEPDRLEIGFTLGPRVLMSIEGLERTGLLGLGSRVGYRVLVRLPGRRRRPRCEPRPRPFAPRSPTPSSSRSRPTPRRSPRCATRSPGSSAFSAWWRCCRC